MAVPETVEERILDGVLACVARWGVAKTTLDDVAREAGCSRATLYRVFPGGKEAVLGAALSREVGRIRASVGAALAAAEDLAGGLAAALAAAGAFITGHPALQFVLAYEPELVTPHLAFPRDDVLLREASDALAPGLARWLGPEEAGPAAEWLCRVAVSYLLCPSPEVRMTDVASVRRLVDRFVLPSLTGRRLSTVP